MRNADGTPYSEPDTSKLSADAMTQAKKTRDRRRIVEFLSRHGPIGATDEEIQMALEIDGNTERPRRGELVTLGVVEKSGEKRRGTSGRMAAVWVVKS